MNGLFSLYGKVAIVTGANTGIGQGVALALADAGADIAAVGRTPPTEMRYRSQLVESGHGISEKDFMGHFIFIRIFKFEIVSRGVKYHFCFCFLGY